MGAINGTDRQTHTHTDRQTDRHTHTHTLTKARRAHLKGCVEVTCVAHVAQASTHWAGLLPLEQELALQTIQVTHKHKHQTQTQIDKQTDTRTPHDMYGEVRLP